MNVKIVYDPDENEFIAFIKGINIVQGYGSTEKDAIVDFLIKCESDSRFNKTVIRSLLNQMQ